MKVEYFILIIFITSIYSIDPITIGSGIGLGLLGYNYKTFTNFVQSSFCNYVECCDDQNIPGNIKALEADLKSSLFGQHIVIDELPKIIGSHLKHRHLSKKPLVIVFDGTPGTGKNYVTDFIVKNLYKYGYNSTYVHKSAGRSHYPTYVQADIHKEAMFNTVTKTVEKCPRSLFIFDEIDKIQFGIFESITPLLDYHHNIDNIDYRQAIFLFLSNTAGVNISKYLIQLMKQGVPREKTTLNDFKHILEGIAYNKEGGLYRAGMIDSHLIDHFVPFLPMEKIHVERCIKAEFARYNVTPSEENIKKVFDTVGTYEKETGLFVTSGCKKVSKEVAKYQA